MSQSSRQHMEGSSWGGDDSQRSQKMYVLEINAGTSEWLRASVKVCASGYLEQERCGVYRTNKEV